MLRARALAEGGQLGLARELLAAALPKVEATGSHDERVDTRLQLAGVLTDLGDSAGCLVHADVVLMQAGLTGEQEHRTRVLQSTAAARLGRLGDALVASGRALALAESSFERGNALAQHVEQLVAAGRTQDAERHLEGVEEGLELLAADPRVRIQNALGELHRGQGRLDQAERWYRLALRDDPRPARRALIALNLALIALQRGDLGGLAAALEEPRDHYGRSEGVGEACVLGLSLPLLLGTPPAFDAAFARMRWLTGRHRLLEPDLARALDRVAELAQAQGELARAVRCRAVALAWWRALDAPQAAGTTQALRALAARGAPLVVGRFELLGTLGAGGTGTVYRARHLPTGRDAAVKLLDIPQTWLLDSEVRTIAGLDHPHVVRVFDHGPVGLAAQVMGELAPDTRFVAMALADQGSLAERVGQMAWTALEPLLLQLLEALAHAHARGLVHLDLKPNNLLLHQGRLVLADFGIARAAGPVTGRKLAGTPAYMAPEQIQPGLGALGPWTDLYALGCTVWEMVTGVPPCPGGAVREVLSAHLRGDRRPFQPIVAVPAGLEAWLGWMLARDPEGRCHHPAVAAEGLEALGPAVSTGISAAPARPAGASLTWTTGLDIPAPHALVGRSAPRSDRPLRGLETDWRAGGSPPAVERGSGPELFAWRRPPLVGRERERDRLWAALQRAVGDGQAQAIHVVGADGVGKSRLVTWFSERVRELAVATTLNDADLSQDAGLDQDVARLVDASRQGPVVVELDQAHGLEELVERALRLPRAVVLVTTGLSEENRPEGAELVTLQALSEQESEALVDDLLPLADSLKQGLIEASGGNPQYMVQLLAQWVHQEQLVLGPRGYEVRHGAELRMPDHLHDAWLGRLESTFTAPERQCLRLAAALGGGFGLRTWQRACEAAELGAPDAALETARRAGLMRGTRAARFVAPGLRESLLRQAREAQAMPALHAACAAALQALPSSKVGRELGEHLLALGRWEEARLALVLRAATVANTGWQDDAVALLARASFASDVGGLGPSAEEALARLHLANARYDTTAGALAARRYAELADTDGARALADRCAATEARSRGDLGRAEQLLARAERLDPSPGNLANCRESRGLVRMRQARWAEARADLLEAEALFVELGEHANASSVCVVLGQLWPQQSAEAEGIYLRGLALAERSGLASKLAGILNGLAEVARARGSLDVAERRYREAMELWRAFGGGRAIVAALNLGMVQIARGDVAAALAGARTLDRELVALGRQDMRVFAASVALPGLAADPDAELDAGVAQLKGLIEETGLMERDVYRCAQAAVAHAATPDRAETARALLAWLARHHPLEGQDGAG